MLRVDEIINVINFKFPSKGRKKRIPDNFCYVCSHIDPRGSRGRNPYRYLFSDGSLRPCKHVPPAPHPTFVSQDDGDDDDGFDDESLDFDDSDDGAMFDTKIVRQDEEDDPRLFKLPPVFGKEDQDPKKRKKGKQSRLVPMVSENTFLTTNKRERRAGADDNGNDATSGGVRLPRLSNQRASLVAEDAGQGRKQKTKDPRRLNSDRIGRRDLDPDVAKVMARSDSSVVMTVGEDGELRYLPEPQSFLSSREKTDPPPQPIVVSIRNQEGESIGRLPQDRMPPGTNSSDHLAAADEKQKSRRRREKKRRARSPTGSASPTFSGSISISRETTLSGFESPDFFFSRVRSASWCECPDHVTSESRCAECRRTSGHEKWCVSRNSLCQKCGKVLRRKYSQMERKSSFGAMPPSGMIISNAFAPSSESPTRSKRHCSPSKTSFDRLGSTVEKYEKDELSNRVRFQEGDKVVYPQWESFPDSGIEEDKHDTSSVVGTGDSFRQGRERKALKEVDSSGQLSSRSFDADVHKRAYDLALASSRAKRMFSKKSQGVESSPRYFSYFPLLKTRKPKPVSGEENDQPEQSVPQIGVRGDMREGKQLKVKKGLKHVLGDVKLEDYYPGGKLYPRPRRQQAKQ